MLQQYKTNFKGSTYIDELEYACATLYLMYRVIT